MKSPGEQGLPLWTYLNGKFVADEDAKIPVTDRSFLYGDGCFEGVGVYRGRILHLRDHVDRMFRSARMLRIPFPVTSDELFELIRKTAAKNKMDELPDGYLRPILTRGSGPMGMQHSRNLGPPTLAIIPQTGSRRVTLGGEIPQLTAVISSYHQASSASLDPAIKTNNYLTHILAYLEAADRGADVAILRTAEGLVTEGHGMNVFCVSSDEVMTPRADLCLRGITRGYVLSVAAELGYRCREASLTTYDLKCSDEVFVTSSLVGVSSVRAIDGEQLPVEVPGPATRKIRERYVELAWQQGTAVNDQRLATGEAMGAASFSPS